jgi:hypothetical protein
LGPQVVAGRTTLRLRLPDAAWVDVEVARAAIHRAESRVTNRHWTHAWGPALIAMLITQRQLLPTEQLTWTETRAELADIRLRALEAHAAAALGIGETELPAAARTGRQLVHLAPLRESGCLILMRALADQSNAAEAHRVYANLTRILRDELGISPSPTSRAAHDLLLHRLA